MKTYLFPLVTAMAVAMLTSTPAIAAPLMPAGPVYTNTEKPNLAPVEGAFGQTNQAMPNAASPTGAVKNMAPLRGDSGKLELQVPVPNDSASGLTIPGASSGSSLGEGSNSTLTPLKKADEGDLIFQD